MQFAVIGNPIAHSLSPILHNYAFKTLGIPAFYGRYLLGTKDSFYHLRSLHLKGANITTPFKDIAFQSCDATFGIAQEIGSVNTILFVQGKMLGYNTDALGFYHAIPKIKTLKSALIIGAGGSAKAIACILRQKDIMLKIINRSSARLQAFSDFECATFDAFKHKDAYDLVINATAAGLIENTLPLPKEILKPLLQNAQFAFDLVYGKETPFLTLAKELGVCCADGKDMLIHQAILAFEIFMESQKIPFDKEILKRSMQEIL